MFNFRERTVGEKVVMVGAATLVVGNTVMNTVNSIKVKHLKKRVTNVENQIEALNNRLNRIEAAKAASSQAAAVAQPQVPQQQVTPQQPQGGNQ